MKDGFYWARWKDDGSYEIVRVLGNSVLLSGYEDDYPFDHFEFLAEFLSPEPLTPPETP